MISSLAGFFAGCFSSELEGISAVVDGSGDGGLGKVVLGTT